METQSAVQDNKNLSQKYLERILKARVYDVAVSQKYLERILKARVYDVAVETPLEPARNLSKRLGNQVLFKREDLQPVFSFKLRGAYNKLAQLPPDLLKKGVACSSAGNHAQGVALASKKLGCEAWIVMPETTPSIKVKSVRDLGAHVIIQGQGYDEAHKHARSLAENRGLTFVHPFDDPDVIAGQGTIAMEIVRQHPGPIDAVFVPVGGGGLISGIAVFLKALFPNTRVIGVQPHSGTSRSGLSGHRHERQRSRQAPPSPHGRRFVSPEYRGRAPLSF